jgi:hypothetical protein
MRAAAVQEGERIDVVEGDFFTDPIANGDDAIILANEVHLFSPQHNRALFQRARVAATPQSVLLIVDFLTDGTHTQPVLAALAAGEFLLVAGEGDVYREEEVRAWLRETGWRPLECKPIAGPLGLLVAEIVRNSAATNQHDGGCRIWPLHFSSRSGYFHLPPRPTTKQPRSTFQSMFFLCSPRPGTTPHPWTAT